MGAKILILGATGTIGKPLLTSLIASGHKVRAASRRLPKSDSIDVEWCEFDYFDRETYPHALQGIERLFLLTPVVPQMVDISAGILDSAKKAGVERIVRLSALGADSKAPFVLGRWHSAVENQVRESGVAFTVLRPNSFMQNYARTHGPAIRKQNAFYLPVDDGKVSLVDARDVASVAAILLTKDGFEGKTYDVTGPQALSNQEIAGILTRELGRLIRFLPISENDAARAMTAAGLPDWLVNALLELYASQKVGEAEAIAPTVKQLTGRPAYFFDQFLKDNISAFRA